MVPRRILGDAVHDHLAHDAIAPGNLGGRAGQRHEAVDEVRIHFSPDPTVHRAHRRAEHELQVIDFQTFRQHQMLRANHVVVGVLRKMRPEAIARLARLPVADPVRQHDEIAGGVQQLARPEELATEGPGEESCASAAGAVKDEHCVSNDARRVAPRRAERPIVQREGRKRLARLESKIACHVVGFDRNGGLSGGGSGNREQRDGYPQHFHRR